MPKFVIEREIPGAGALSDAQIQGISQKSCDIAPDAEAVREHATRGGFPANSVATVRRMIDPTTAE